MKIHLKLTAGLAAWSLLVVGAAWARPQKHTANRLTAGVNFADKASQGNRAEIKLAQLAEQKTTNNNVKQFAKENITLPTTLAPMDQAEYDNLSKLNGAAFDRAYMRDMVANHKTDLQLFKNEAAHGTSPQIKAWAQQYEPVIAEHYQLAQSTEKKVK
jgi:putative membrane protein